MPSSTRAATRLLLLSIGALLVVGGLMAFFLQEVREWELLAARLARESHEATLDGIFHSAMTRATAEAVSYTATGNQEYAREATDALLFAQSAMTQLRRIGADRSGSAQWEKMAALRREQEEVLSQVRRSVNQALRLRPSADAVTVERLEQLYAPESEADRIWLAVVTWHDSERRSLHQALRAQRQQVLWIALAALIASMVGAFLVRALVMHDLIAPLRGLTRKAQRLADGEPDVTFPVTAAGDLGDLQQALGRLAQRMRDPVAAAPVGAIDGVSSQESGTAVATAAPPATETLPETAAAGLGRQRRALLLSADATERELTRAMLQHCGMDVTALDNAREAANCLDRGDFDVIVMDLGPTDPISNDAVTQDGAVRPGSRHIPAIVLGPDSSTAPPPGWLIAGFDQYLKRPFSYFDLHAALSHSVANP